MQTKLDSILEAIVQTLMSFTILLMAESVIVAIIYALILAVKSYIIRRLFHIKTKKGLTND